MKESFWGIMIFVFGVVSILIVFFFQSLTNTSEHNYVLLKEATEGAMIDAIDLAYYREEGLIRIDQEKFVENFVRRFAQSAQLSRDYVIEIYDVNEEPPKVSLAISSVEKSNDTNEILEFNLIDRLDAILEMPKNFCHYDTTVEASQSVVINMPTQVIEQLNKTTHWEKEGGSYTSDKDQSVSDNGEYKIECTKQSTGKYLCQKYIRVANTSSGSSGGSQETEKPKTEYRKVDVVFEQKFTGNTSNGSLVTWIMNSSKAQKFGYDASSKGTTSKRICKCSTIAITNGKQSCSEYTCQDYTAQKSMQTQDTHKPDPYYNGDKSFPLVRSYETSNKNEAGRYGNRIIVCNSCARTNSFTGACTRYICDVYERKS